MLKSKFMYVFASLNYFVRIICRERIGRSNETKHVVDFALLFKKSCSKQFHRSIFSFEVTACDNFPFVGGKLKVNVYFCMSLIAIKY